MEPTYSFEFNGQIMTLHQFASFQCHISTHANNFTPLMYMIMNARNLNSEKELAEYIATHKEEIDKQNSKGWTALMLACANCNICSTRNAVRLLVEGGAN